MKKFCGGILNGTAVVFSAVVFSVLVLASSCGDSDVFEVGVAFPLSGVSEGLGENMEKGVELAVEEINASGGTNLRLIFEDTEGTPDGAEKAFRKLVGEEAVSAIIGPWSSSSTKRTAPVANESKVVAISPTSAASPSGITAPGDFIFRTSLTVDKLVPEGIRETKSARSYSKAATIVNTADDFSVSSNEEVVKALKADSDVEIVTKQTFSRKKTDDLPALAGQLSAIKDSGAEVVFVSALSPGRQGVIVEARKQGIDIPLVITLLTTTDVKAAQKMLGKSVGDVFTVASWVADSTSDFFKKYSNRYGESPDAYSARSYVSVQILAEAIARASTRSSEDVRAALQMMNSPETGLDTIFGKFYFDRNGDGVYSPVVKVVRDGRFADIDPGDG